MNTVTLTEAKENLEQIIEQVVSDVEPMIITTDSGKNTVLLSLDEFNAWQETLYLFSTPANAEHLRQSIAQAEAGETVERGLVEA
jgi:antitoxin YefM